MSEVRRRNKSGVLSLQQLTCMPTLQEKEKRENDEITTEH